MPTTALIICDTLTAGEPEPFLFRIGGQSVLERMIIQLRAARVIQILVFAPIASADLTSICGKADSANCRVRIMRNNTELADSLHPHEDVWFLDGPFLAPQAVFEKFSEVGGPLLLTVPADAGARFERIDAKDHWAGLGRVDGTLVRETAAQLGDWALAPTLLRRAIQNGAQRQQVAIAGNDWQAMRPVSVGELAETQLILVDPSKESRENGIVVRALDGLIYRNFGRALLGSNLSYNILAFISILLTLCNIIFAVSGFTLFALIAFCAACATVSAAGLLFRLAPNWPHIVKIALLRDVSIFPLLWLLAIIPLEPGLKATTVILAMWLAVQWAFACLLRRGRGFIDALALWLILGVFSLANFAVVGLGLCITLLLAEQAWLEVGRSRSAR